ncbi:hypothetical protein LVISKB_2381 [Levilactobacillus brevis KB290]|uniref:Uncharacterized protein n=1 Tax=Levilactobacillus brevis KB290 TaxID=1001583 RepID=M5B1L3_LEVBR|nr:hypothetical protein LVISKB_2381 [Levilactobacillus brevis KB290]
MGWQSFVGYGDLVRNAGYRTFRLAKRLTSQPQAVPINAGTTQPKP